MYLRSVYLGFYSSSNTPITSQNQVIENDPTISSIENDNSDDRLQEETDTSPLPNVASNSSIANETDSIAATQNDSSMTEISSTGKNKYEHFFFYALIFFS